MRRVDRKPKPVDIAALLTEDKCFLLAVIDSPVKAFNAYSIDLDDESLEGFLAVAQRVRAQAAEMLGEVARTWIDGDCNACNNCCV
ncbi:MAG: hypothetical protein FJX74_21535 [Armatimonadetes bacterium]|nr:hypothetical protein [Armatimonadota bacterium]